MNDDADPVERLVAEADMPDEPRQLLLAAAKAGRGTRRQHVVPAGYLRAWADEQGMLRVWDTEQGKTFLASAKDVCVQGDFYTTELVTGEQSRFVEGMLAMIEDEYLSTIRGIAEGHPPPENPRRRWPLALEIAIQDLRVPQRRRMMNAMAESLTRTVAGQRLAGMGLDPYGFTVEVGAGFHANSMLENAVYAAMDLMTRDWTLHIAPRPWFATCDAPVLYAYYAAPDFEALAGHPIADALRTQAISSGSDLTKLSSGLATTDHILLPLTPTALLEMGSERTGSSRVTCAHARIRKLSEKLLVRCRERMIIGHPEQDFLRNRSGQALRRRRQHTIECARTMQNLEGGECTIRTGFSYAAAPVVALCGNHY